MPTHDVNDLNRLLSEAIGLVNAVRDYPVGPDGNLFDPDAAVLRHPGWAQAPIVAAGAAVKRTLGYWPTISADKLLFR